ncbi:MAG: hypothetical protein K9K40_08910 [Desulfotignum sp.]|nr:hypothetical protein [Desulfotignum sp.]
MGKPQSPIRAWGLLKFFACPDPAGQVLSSMAKSKLHNIDDKQPYEPLVDLIGFQTKPGNRIKDYLKSHGMLKLSLIDLMDLFLPPASNAYITEDNFWLAINLELLHEFTRRTTIPAFCKLGFRFFTTRFTNPIIIISD